MRKSTSVLILLGAIFVVAGMTWAQRQRVSPHETVSATVAGKKITIEYGRPYMKGREIFGGLVPKGKVWRTGADEATKLTAEGDLMIGATHVPAGSYSLFTIPGDGEWTLVINKVAEQWGAFKYDQGRDLGRTAMKVTNVSSPLEQFTISLESKGDSEATLKMAWDTTEAAVSIMAH